MIIQRPLSVVAAAGVLLTLSSNSHAEWDWSAAIGTELRVFIQDAAYPDQLDTFQPSMTFETELNWRSESGDDELVFLPYARLDSRDTERTHFDLREGYWLHIGDSYDLLVGTSKVFWGVAESRHLVDTINQVDSVEDIDEEDRLGQPMVRLALQRDWGEISGFVLPLFRERTFNGSDGRLRPPLPVDTDRAEVDEAVDLALRYSHFFGDWDVGLHVFRGTSREPRFVPAPDGSRFLPFYDLMTQGGVDLQYTTGAWLWKLEVLVRDTELDRFQAAVGGFEYTFFGITETGADLGVLVEYQYDDRDIDLSPFTINDNDVFAGTRLALNDAEDSALLAGLIVDAAHGSISGLLEAERRFAENWFVEFESRFFANVADTDFLSAFDRDSFVTFRATRYF